MRAHRALYALGFVVFVAAFFEVGNAFTEETDADRTSIFEMLTTLMRTVLTLLLCVLGACLLRWGVRKTRSTIRPWSFWLHRWLPGRVPEAERYYHPIRKQIATQPIPSAPLVKSNDHAKAASSRSASRWYLYSLCSAVGIPTYSISKSNQDIRDGRLGNRPILSPKDTTYIDYVDDDVPQGTYAAVYIDVANHLGKREFKRALANSDAVVAIAGQQFRDTGGNDAEQPFWYSPDTREWTYEVAGSDTYQERVWDLDGETCTVQELYYVWKPVAFFEAVLFAWLVTTFTSQFPAATAVLIACFVMLGGVRGRTIVRKILRKDVSEHRVVAFLVPTRVHGTARTILTWGLHEGPTRLEPTVYKMECGRKLLALRVRKGRETYISVGYSKTGVAVRFTDKMLSIARSVHTSKPKDMPTTGRVSTLLANAGVAAVPNATTLMLTLFVYTEGLAPNATSALRQEVVGLRTFTAMGDPGDDFKTGVRNFCNGATFISGGSVVPVKTKLNEQFTVARRIKEARGAPVPLTNEVNRAMDQFVTEIVKVAPHDLPLFTASLDEVVEKQTRPAQRAIITFAIDTWNVFATFIQRGFQKAEPNTTVKAARNITTMDPDSKIRASTVFYRLSAYAKNLPWYTFGRNLTDVGYAIGNILSKQPADNPYVGAVATDFKNMDGSIPGIMREMERRIALASFDYSEHEFVSKVMDEQHGNTVRLAFGTQYEQGTGRGSGFGDTSWGNTMDAAFIVLLALMRCGLTFQEAWRNLGLYGGDDGISPVPQGTDPKEFMAALEEVSTEFGMIIKCEFVPHGQPVPFLSRFYGEVWVGGANSMADPRRQMSKLTCTTREAHVDPRIIAHDKGRSYAVTDAQTPGIGDVARKWAAIVVDDDHVPELSWRAQGDPCINVRASWMEDVWAQQFGLKALEVLEAYADPAVDWMDIPTIDYRDVTLRKDVTIAVVDGVIHYGGVVLTPEETYEILARDNFPLSSSESGDLVSTSVPASTTFAFSSSSSSSAGAGVGADKAAGPGKKPARAKGKQPKRSREEQKAWDLEHYGAEACADFAKLTPAQRKQAIKAKRDQRRKAARLAKRKRNGKRAKNKGPT